MDKPLKSKVRERYNAHAKMTMLTDRTGSPTPQTLYTAKPTVLGSVLKELLRRRELIVYLTISQLKQSYQNLALGYLWWFLNPLLWMVVYWLLVVGIFDRGEPNYPLFLLCAIIPWRAFVTSIGQAMTCISGQERLIKQIPFPKAALPLSVVLANTVNLVFGLLVLLAVTLAYGIPLTPYALLLPLVALVQIAFTAGLAFLLSVLAVYFADLQNFMQFFTRIWLYLSPALYAVERVPVRFRTLFMINPFAPIFTSYRDVLMYGRAPDWFWLGVAALLAAAVLIVGFWYFVREEPRIVKVI